MIKKENLDKTNAWPFVEAKKMLRERKSIIEKKGKITLQTGYGPSGLPHIGTFGEVARTTMMINALNHIQSIETDLITFSDDMDGFRKIPDNVPNHEMLAAYLHMPLTKVIDPFGTAPSFGEHNNLRLQAFLDSFGFQYEFMSSTDCYLGGKFDSALLRVLEHYDAIMNIMLPTLGLERQATYSPFFPVCPDSGKVLQAKVIHCNTSAGTFTYIDPDSGAEREVLVTGGQCKLQWKCDWAMRWYALGVDYEMSGKDLIDSVTQSSKITHALGGTPPAGISYELFLDANGEKISKSKGNGITINEWLKYANPESLSLYMYQKPRRAKKLSFDVIPKAVDEYQTFLEKYSSQTNSEQLNNPVFHIHNGHPNSYKIPVTFALILNLVNASQADNKDVLWGFIKSYIGDISEDAEAYIGKLLDYALSYFNDFILPTKVYRVASDDEIKSLKELAFRFSQLDKDSEAETIQTIVYDIGKEAEYENLRDWFMALYQILLGQEQGPRFGSFVALYGIDKTCELINKAINKELA